MVDIRREHHLTKRRIAIKNDSIERYVPQILLVLCVVYVVTACVHSPHTPSLEDLQHMYVQAIADAEVAEPHEISINLIAIVPSNEALSWDRERKTILVTTWTSWDVYDAHVGTSLTLSREVWITVVPDVKDFCRTHPLAQTAVSLRLEQLLGLPPQSGKTRFVEMWVSPHNLFRPAPDPEISDHEAELGVPVSAQFVTVSEEYQTWFHHQVQYSYGADGYPWTRLGYTYDWGNPTSEVGLSEFVIRAGATVSIHAVVSTLEYCQQTQEKEDKGIKSSFFTD